MHVPVDTQLVVHWTTTNLIDSPMRRILHLFYLRLDWAVSQSYDLISPLTFYHFTIEISKIACCHIFSVSFFFVLEIVGPKDISSATKSLLEATAWQVAVARRRDPETVFVELESHNASCLAPVLQEAASTQTVAECCSLQIIIHQWALVFWLVKQFILLTEG